MRSAWLSGGAAAMAVALCGFAGCGQGVPAQGGAGAAARAPVTHAVAIRQVTFTPATVASAPGDTIVWSNRDLVPHTVTARDGRFDSRNLPPDSTWRWVVSGPDSAAYSCTYHTTMHGVVRIAAAR